MGDIPLLPSQGGVRGDLLSRLKFPLPNNMKIPYLGGNYGNQGENLGFASVRECQGEHFPPIAVHVSRHL